MIFSLIRAPQPVALSYVLTPLGINDAVAVIAQPAAGIDSSFFSLVSRIAFATVVAGEYHGEFAVGWENDIAIKHGTGNIMNIASA